MSDKITVYDIQMTAPPKVVVDQPDISADRADVEEGWVYDTWAEAAARVAHCMRTHPGGLVLVGQHEITREEYASLGPDPDPLPPSTDYQQNVAAWAHACFGAQHATDPLERADRFCEEALELLQAAGYDPLRIEALLDYVYARPAGQLAQEVGGVLVTLAAFCAAHGVRMEAQGDWELARVWANVEKIRAKHAAKPRGSALPGAVPSGDEFARWNAAQAGIIEATHGKRGSGWGDRVPRQWPIGMADALAKVPPITPDMSPVQVAAVRDMLTLIIDNARTVQAGDGLQATLTSLDVMEGDK